MGICGFVYEAVFDGHEIDRQSAGIVCHERFPEFFPGETILVELFLEVLVVDVVERAFLDGGIVVLEPLLGRLRIDRPNLSTVS